MNRPVAATMRRAPQGAFDIAPGCLGSGCASLGSRISAQAGLRALARAHELGVNWFDVAPAYGAGEAETILAEFIKGRRDRILLTTKVGMAPPARLGAIKLLYALGRPAIGAVSGLRRAFRKVAATRNVHVALTSELIETSISASLKRLGTDRVDVFALHDPAAEDVARENVRRALERVVARGQARRIAVAGDGEACAAALRAGAPYEIVQMSVAAFAENASSFTRADQRVVLHSVFGLDGQKRRLERILAQQPARMQALIASGYDANPSKAAADLLVDSAFALNPDGIVLASMFDIRNLEANLARAMRPVAPGAPALLADMLAGA